MNPIVPKARSAGILFALAMSLATPVFLPAPVRAAGKTGVAEAQAELPPPPPSPAMQDKFRKLQREMENSPRASGPAPAAGTAGNPAPEGRAVGTVAVQILFGLAFVLLLAVVTIRVLKRMQGRLLSKPGRSGDIFEVLETCHLGSQQRVVALRMNEEVGIVGVTQHGISLLTVLKEPAEELRGTRESNSAAFSDNLNKLLERFKKPKKVSDLLDEGAG
ncbi:MAG TPA: flagellar biosynthetic protein FliO [Fibrobacteria bacterium]|nr:flagellar biosynthetic protein FliO [Fibrobacteria bacterium]